MKLTHILLALVAGAILAVLLGLAFQTQVTVRTGPQNRVGRTSADPGARARVRSRVSVPGPAGPVVIDLTTRPPRAELEWTLRVVDGERGDVLEERSGAGAQSEFRIDLPERALSIEFDSAAGFVEPEPLRVDGHEDNRRVSATLVAWSSLEGSVTDAFGNALPGATVFLIPDETAGAVRVRPQQANSDEQGRFLVAGLRDDVTYVAGAVAPGFASQREFGIAIAAGETMALDFTLAQAARVTGRLLDSDASALAGVRLAVSGGTRQGGGIVWAHEGNATSDASGAFVFDGLSGGRKRVQALIRNEPGETRMAQWEFELDAARVRPMGDLVPPDTRLRLQLRYPENDTPVSGRLRVYVVPDAWEGDGQAGMMMIPAELDAGGRFDAVGLPAGRVDVTVSDTRTYPDGQVRPPLRQAVDFDGGHAECVLTLPALRAPDETVPTDPGHEHGVRHTRIVFAVERPLAEETEVLVYSDRSEDVVVHRLTTLTATEQGGFALDCVEGDAIHVVVKAGRQFAERTVTTRGASMDVGDLTPRSAGVSYRVLALDDGRPIPGATVFIGPSGNGIEGRVPIGRTGRDGTLDVTGLPPGHRVEFSVQIGGRESGVVPAQSSDVYAAHEVAAPIR